MTSLLVEAHDLFFIMRFMGRCRRIYSQSSSFRAFSENGTFSPNGEVLVRNENSWNRAANMLCLETPVRVGISYSTDTQVRKVRKNLGKILRDGTQDTSCLSSLPRQFDYHR